MWPFDSKPSVPGPAAGPAPVAGPIPLKPRRATWGFAEGDALADGRFLLRPLGGGSLCEVWLAWDERLLSLVVAKILRPDQVGETRARAELEREAALLARLAHPGLVRGFGAALDAPRPHLVLEHVEGPTLVTLVRRYGPLPMVQLLPVSLHLAAVLHYLAGEGVAHLDVKPGNVVVSVTPRLLDLGIALPVERAARLSRAVGTDSFMAPEQCAPGTGRGTVGPAADVWALGATLSYAACGEVPYPRADGARHSPDPLVRFPQLSGLAPRLPDDAPPALTDLLARMLAPDPGRRPAAREVAEALEPLVAGLPTQVSLPRRARASR
jgi:serine/threonine protein kinase